MGLNKIAGVRLVSNLLFSLSQKRWFMGSPFSQPNRMRLLHDLQRRFPSFSWNLCLLGVVVLKFDFAYWPCKEPGFLGGGQITSQLSTL